MRKNNHTLSLFKAAVSAIPWVGGSIASLIGDYFPSSTQDSKAKEFNNFDKVVEKQNQAVKNDLTLEIDHNLILLHDFWEKKQGYLNKPLSLSGTLHGAQQIVVSKTENSITTASIDSIEHDIDLPQWHRKEFDKPTSLCGLSVKEKQGVRQVYDNLGQITSKYDKIKKFGDKVVEKTHLNERFKTLVTEVLDRGNPLKAT